MGIPGEFINEVVSRNDIAEVISDCGIELKRESAKSLSACCPFHEEKTPSFKVNTEKQSFYCYGCGEGGDAIAFVRMRKGLQFPQAIKFLASRAGMMMPKPEGGTGLSPEEAKDKKRKAVMFRVVGIAEDLYHSALPSHSEAMDYLLRQRGFAPTTLEKFRVGFAPDSWDFMCKSMQGQFSPQMINKAGLTKERNSGKGFYDFMRNRIIFPIRNTQGTPVAFGGRVMDDSKPKYINSSESLLYKKSNILYGLYECLQTEGRTRELTVVEGYLDVLRAHENGLNDHCATCGTALTEQHARTLFRYADTITFVFDGDKAGKEAAWKSVVTMLPLLSAGKQIQCAFLPSDEDPDSFIRNKGADAYKQYTSAAAPLSVYFFDELSRRCGGQTPEELARMLAEGRRLIRSITDEDLKTMMGVELGKRLGVSIEDAAQPLAPDANTLSEPLASAPINFHKSLDPRFAKIISNASPSVRRVCATLALHPERVGALPQQVRDLIDLKPSPLPIDDWEMLSFIVKTADAALTRGVPIENVLASNHKYLVLFLREKAQPFSEAEKADALGKFLSEAVPLCCGVIEENMDAKTEGSKKHYPGCS